MRTRGERRCWLASWPLQRASRTATLRWRSPHIIQTGALQAIRMILCSRQQIRRPVHSCSRRHGKAAEASQPLPTAGIDKTQSCSQQGLPSAAASRSMPWGRQRRTYRSAWPHFCPRKCSSSQRRRYSLRAASPPSRRLSHRSRPRPRVPAGARPASRAPPRRASATGTGTAAAAGPSAAACSGSAAGRSPRGNPRQLTPRQLPLQWQQLGPRCTRPSAASAARSAPSRCRRGCRITG